MKTIKIGAIKIKHILDENPDTSFLGEFSSKPGPGAINHKERHGERNSYEYFNPAIPEYTEQDYKRMMQLNNGDFNFLGIRADAGVRSSKAWAPSGTAKE